MAVELKEAALDVYRKLPQDHPDKKFIGGVLDVFEGYLDAKETPAEIKRFSPEARKALEREGYVINELTGQSIRSLREADRNFSSAWHNNYPKFEALTSKVSEVAINPRQFFLPQSNGKTLPEHEAMVAQFSRKLARKIAGVKAVIGEVVDYAELYFTHLDATGQHLFGQKQYGFNWIMTKTLTVGSRVALVCRSYAGSALPRLDINHWEHDRGRSDTFAAPLVVPA